MRLRVLRLLEWRKVIGLSLNRLRIGGRRGKHALVFRGGLAGARAIVLWLK
jgi:hypothetical protein